MLFSVIFVHKITFKTRLHHWYSSWFQSSVNLYHYLSIGAYQTWCYCLKHQCPNEEDIILKTNGELLLGSDSDVTKQVLRCMGRQLRFTEKLIPKEFKAQCFVKASITIEAWTWFICLSIVLFDLEEEWCAVDTRWSCFYLVAIILYFDIAVCLDFFGNSFPFLWT